LIILFYLLQALNIKTILSHRFQSNDDQEKNKKNGKGSGLFCWHYFFLKA